jgi:hypothetical protein
MLGPLFTGNYMREQGTKLTRGLTISMLMPNSEKGCGSRATES